MSISRNKNYILATLSIVLLFACGPSPEKIAEQERLTEEARILELKRRSDLAIVTCNLMGESRDADAAIRIKEINSARERLGEDFYIGTDAGIRESFVYGLCKELVLNDPDYTVALKEEKEKARIAREELFERLETQAKEEKEKARIDRERKAEEERIAKEKKAEEERIAKEKKAEEERIRKEKEAEYPRPIFRVIPQYPRRAQENRVEGYVIVEYTVSESGNVKDPNVIEGKCKSANDKENEFKDCSMFNSTALKAILKMNYVPAVRDGKRVAVENMKYRFNWELDE
jgi:flagellar biosynthesis GTPase FlhF